MHNTQVTLSILNYAQYTQNTGAFETTQTQKQHGVF